MYYIHREFQDSDWRLYCDDREEKHLFKIFKEINSCGYLKIIKIPDSCVKRLYPKGVSFSPAWIGKIPK